MKPGEIHELKRENFLNKARENFKFLVSEYGFSEPVHLVSQQPNGTITREDLFYERMDIKLTIANAYHPVDYGFEMRITDSQSGESNMIHYVLKENQDVEQSYLEKAAELLKTEYVQSLRTG